MASNIMVNAGAGTGKTFCVTEGVHRMIGNKRKTTGSEEQQAIWEEMCSDPYPGRIGMTSFTVDASDQLAMKGPIGPDGKPLAASKSTYGMGLGFAKRKGQAGYVDIYGNKYRSLTTEFLGGTKFETSQADPGLWDAIYELQFKARLDLIVKADDEKVKKLADWYGIDIPPSKQQTVTEGINAVLAAGREQVGTYDFVDQVYLPVVHDLVHKTTETLIVDEGQDMGIAQQEICLRSSYRRIIIGDPHQAIFGFAGADSDAFGRLGRYLEMTQAGVKWFPLNMTRRCAKAIVREANTFVPELTPLPNAPEGDVKKVKKGDFWGTSIDRILTRYKGSKGNTLLGPQQLMIICPTNAPLISVMFKLKMKGINSFINGGDITASMIKFVKKNGEQGVGQLRIEIQRKLDQIENRRMSKNKQVQLDLYEALQEIALSCHTTSAVESTISNMFSDTRRPGWIELSSIHKAKGREADTVVIWNIDRCRSPYSTMPWQHQQDRNLEYVADTRAKTLLYQVRSQ